MSAVSLLPDRPPYFNPSPTFKKVGQFVEKVCFFKNAGSLSLQECFVGFTTTIAGKQNKQSVHLKARVVARGKG